MEVLMKLDERGKHMDKIWNIVENVWKSQQVNISALLYMEILAWRQHVWW